MLNCDLKVTNSENEEQKIQFQHEIIRLYNIYDYSLIYKWLSIILSYARKIHKL